jgi:hypothetical protein
MHFLPTFSITYFPPSNRYGIFLVTNFVYYARWPPQNLKRVMPAAIVIRIFVIVELRPDRGGLVRPYINYLGRDEGVCIFMGDISE